MSSHTLAVVVWPMGAGICYGRPAFHTGDPLETARRTPAGVVAAIKDELVERGEAPREVEEPRMERRIVEVRPTLTAPPPPKKKGKKSRPDKATKLGAGDVVRLPVDVVWGALGPDLYLCEIVQFEHTFYLRDPARLGALVEHFVRDAAASEPVDALFARTLWPAPQLEVTTLRIPEEDTRSPEPETDRLAAIAERVKGPPPGAPGVWERRAEVDACTAALGRRRSLLVIGEPRSGRSAVLYEAIRQRRKDPPVWRTQAQRLVAGAKYLGEWQELTEKLVHELTESGGVLWIEDLVRLFRVGGRGPEDSVGAYLKPALAEGLRLVGELTPREVEAVRVLSPGFLDLFEEVHVGPLSSAALGNVVELLVEHHRTARGVRVEPQAHRLARRLLERFVREEAFPGKIVRFLGDCVGEAARSGRTEVDAAAVLTAFTERSGMPAVLLDDRQPLPPETLRTWLATRVVGQPEAVDAVTRALVTFKAGLNDPDRPVATVLFAGPTGVGKTATARALAEWAFGSDTALVRVDMSECQHPAQIARLIGEPGGEPGELVRRVRERPFAVVLLDEIEKAHPVFFDTLLGLLDEGTLTDAFGRVTSFRGCVVVMTTNLGTRRGGSLGFGGAAEGLDTTAIRNFFRPEFLNRIDRVVPFSPLDEAGVRRIAERELAELPKRPGFTARRLQVVCAEEVVERVVRAGFDPHFGARPLQRAVEQVVVAALARFLLERPDVTDTVLAVEVRDGEVVVG